jgi:hypothetical protein
MNDHASAGRSASMATGSASPEFVLEVTLLDPMELVRMYADVRGPALPSNPISTQSVQQDSDALLLTQTRSWMLTTVNRAIAGEAAVMLQLADVRGRVVTSPYIPSLASALWLQASRELTEGVTFRPCTRCGRMFEVTRDRRKDRKTYCGTVCKVAAHRERGAADPENHP